MSDTPRTDAALCNVWTGAKLGFVRPEFARTLERELAILTKHAPNRAASIVKMARENERLEEENKELRNKLAASEPVAQQNARFAIDGAIAYGQQGANKPPSADHWLMPYWQIGHQLAKQQHPDGYAVTMANGRFVGIWQDRETANMVVGRNPQSEGEQVRAMWFAPPAALSAQQPVAIDQALSMPACERLRDFAEVGPAQRGALEAFVAALRADLAAAQEGN